MDNEFIYGQVDWYDSDKGFGMIILSNNEEVFVHRTSVLDIIRPTDFVHVGSVINNVQKNRKEAKTVKKISRDKLKSHFKSLKNHSLGKVLLLYKKLGTAELKEFIDLKTQEFTKIIDLNEYLIAREWLDALNDKLSHDYSEKKLFALKHVYSVSNDYFKNQFWLDCFWTSEELIKDDLSEYIVNAKPINCPYNQKELDEYILPIDSFLLKNIFNLQTKNINDVCKTISQAQTQMVFELALRNIESENSINFFSNEFKFLAEKGGKSHKDLLVKCIKEKWQDYIDKENKATIINVLNCYGESISNLIPCIFNNSKELFVNELLDAWVNGELKTTSEIHVISRLRVDRKFETLVLSLNNYTLSIGWTVRSKVFEYLSKKIYSIDSEEGLSYLDNLICFVSSKDRYFYGRDGEIDTLLRYLVENSESKYKFILRDHYHIYDDAVKFLYEIGAYLKYTKEITNRLLTCLFPNQNLDYFNTGYSKGWSEDFIDKCNFKKYKALIDLFIEELKTSKVRRTKDVVKFIHSATDFANFTFCPASYTLTRIYDFPKKDNLRMFVGNELHEKQHLLDFVKEFKTNSLNYIGEKLISSNEFIRIANSILLDSGHNENSTLYYSKNKKVCGIPDYIFKDSNSLSFAVEEKFTFQKKKEGKKLYNNHKAQALTYLYGLDGLKLSNVYVIYWYIERQGEKYIATDVDIFNISYSIEHKELVLNIFNNIEKLNANESIQFSNNSLNYKKCVNCSLFSLCDYKKGVINELNLTF